MTCHLQTGLSPLPSPGRRGDAQAGTLAPPSPRGRGVGGEVSGRGATPC